MTDYTRYERSMSRDEMALRLTEAELKLTNYRTLLKGAIANASALSLENEKLKRQNKLLNDEVNKLKNDYYGVLNKYSDLNKDYHELKKQKEDLDADIAKKVLDNIELNEQIEKDIQDYNKLFHEKEKLEKEAKERRVVFEPTSYLLDIQAKDEEIKTLRKKNLDLKNEIEALKDALHDNEVEIHKLKEERDGYCWYFDSCEKTVTELRTKVKCLPTTQPLYIENLNVTYYANGPIWTNEEDKDDISGSDDQN